MSSPDPENTSSHSAQQRESGESPRPVAAGADAAASPVNIIPVAPLLWRMLAGVMDGVLLLIFSLFLLSRILLPMEYPEAYAEFRQMMAEHVEMIQKASAENLPTPAAPDIAGNPRIAEMFGYGTQIFALCMLVYFVACEQFLKGGSLGKSMFRLRVISLRTGRGPNLWESFLRSLIKICTLVVPLLWINYLVVFANKMRRAGHDLLSQTIVVSDTAYVPHLTEPARRATEDE